MSGDTLVQQRRELLAKATGKVLEIGFGTGLNLPYYPATVATLTAIDSNAGAAAMARNRLETAPFPVELRTLNGESLPLRDGEFDTVVSTWTLCSIRRVETALREVRRVLKLGGQLLFIEHGLSPDRRVQMWQNRLNPVQNVIGDGCNLNRNIPALIAASPLRIVQLEEFYLAQTPSIMGYSFKGVAQKE